MRERYWETGEVPQVVDTGKQRIKYYKAAQVIEICNYLDENGNKTEFRRQSLSAHKLQKYPELTDIFLDFLEGCGVATKLNKEEA